MTTLNFNRVAVAGLDYAFTTRVMEVLYARQNMRDNEPGAVEALAVAIDDLADMLADAGA